MKHPSKIALATLLALASTGAIAQESTDLAVTGKVVPAACTPSLSSANLDWGDISLDSDQVVLPKKTLTVSVACQAQTRFALQIVDNKSDSAPIGFPNGGWRGLGLVDNEPVGGYRMWISDYNDLPADGGAQRVHTLLSRDGGTDWSILAGYGALYQIRNEDFLSFSLPVVPVAPTAIQNISFEIHASGLLRPRSDLPSDGFSISGSSTFTLHYL